VVIGATNLIERSDLIGLEQRDGAQTGFIDGAGFAAQQAGIPRPPPGTPEEKTTLLSVLAATRENIALTARELGVSRVTLYRMMRRHGIVPSRGFNATPGTAGASLEDVDGVAPQMHPGVSPGR